MFRKLALIDVCNRSIEAQEPSSRWLIREIRASFDEHPVGGPVRMHHAILDFVSNRIVKPNCRRHRVMDSLSVFRVNKGEGVLV